MIGFVKRFGRISAAMSLGLLSITAPVTQALTLGAGGTVDGSSAVTGVTGTVAGSTTTFNLFTEAFNIYTPDGTSLHMWGYGDADTTLPFQVGPIAQYPGPAMIVDEGQTVVVNVTNNLPLPVSFTVPGFKVTASGGTAGLLTQEAAANGGTATYTFVADAPGTYMYHSATRMELETEMGLVGAIVVRPAGFDQVSNRTLYGDAASAYDRVYLMMTTEADPFIHEQVEQGHLQHIDNTDYHDTLWFINGRPGVDTVQFDFDPILPHQPYGSLAMQQPGERTAVRWIDAGRKSHPQHFHGNDWRVAGRDGRHILGREGNTLNGHPKQTYEVIWTWTGEKLNYDVYLHDPGHTCKDDVDNKTGVAPGDGFADLDADYPGNTAMTTARRSRWYCPRIRT